MNLSLKLSSMLIVVVLSSSTTAQRDACQTQDETLDSCLDAAGATDAQKTNCDDCIESIATNTLVKGAIGNFCTTSNTGACTELFACPCLTCTQQAVGKGECEVTDERSTSGSNCNDPTWGGPLLCPALPPTVEPAPTPAPVPTETPPPGSCDTVEANLDGCLDGKSATEQQKFACTSCLNTIANLAGAIDDTTSATCSEVDMLACQGLENNCDCLGCTVEQIEYGQCAIDVERSENGKTECGPITCGPTPPPTPTDAPASAPSGAVGVTSTFAVLSTAVMAAIVG